MIFEIHSLAKQKKSIREANHVRMVREIPNTGRLPARDKMKRKKDNLKKSTARALQYTASHIYVERRIRNHPVGTGRTAKPVPGFTE